MNNKRLVLVLPETTINYNAMDGESIVEVNLDTSQHINLDPERCDKRDIMISESETSFENKWIPTELFGRDGVPVLEFSMKQHWTQRNNPEKPLYR